MFVKYVLPTISAALLVVAIAHVYGRRDSDGLREPALQPPQSPFSVSVSAAGIVEPRSEEIEVGAPVSGIVSKLFVAVGQRVEVGDPLFQLDDRHLQARLGTLEAELKVVQTELAWLEKQPRPEKIPIAEARSRQAEAVMEGAMERLRRVQALFAKSAASPSELTESRQQFESASAHFRAAEAELALLKAGEWEAVKEITRAKMKLAGAKSRQLKSEIDLLQVRAPIAGEVLAVHVHVGEFVNAPPTRSLVVVGDTKTLHIRANIDEHDIPRFHPEAAARAVLRGKSEISFPLTPVRVEPHVVPKRALTGDRGERVDTRVLQVIYRVDARPKSGLYVGQQLDVYVNASKPTAADSDN